jgi:hypothetical protein
MARQTAVGPFGRGGLSLPIGRCGGGLRIGTVIFLVVIYLIFKAMGVEPMQIMEGGNMDDPGYEQSQRQKPDGSQTSWTDQTTAFVKTVLVERGIPGSRSSSRRANPTRIRRSFYSVARRDPRAARPRRHPIRFIAQRITRSISTPRFAMTLTIASEQAATSPRDTWSPARSDRNNSVFFRN